MKELHLKYLRWLSVWLMIFSTAPLQGQNTLDQKLPVDPHVKIGKLPNGLTYYIRQNEKPENKVELRLVVNAGSILEDNDQQGLAHFAEHMAFNGSENFQKNDIVSFLQSIGVEFGADLNAYTGFDETVYILPIPTGDKENIDKAFQILEDWASTVTFDATEMQSDWAKIGIKAKIVTYEWGEYIKRSKGGENGAMLIGWSGDNGDPDNWLNVLFGCDSLQGNNFSKWCDKKFDGIVKEAKRTTDQAKRTELYKQAQHVLKDAVPMTPIAHSTVFQPMRNEVRDFKISPFGLNSFYGVSVSK